MCGDEPPPPPALSYRVHVCVYIAEILHKS